MLLQSSSPSNQTQKLASRLNSQTVGLRKDRTLLVDEFPRLDLARGCAFCWGSVDLQEEIPNAIIIGGCGILHNDEVCRDGN